MPDAPGARLLVRRARRLRAPHARGRGDLARPRAGARRDRAPVPGRHAGHLRQDAQPRPARRAVPRHLQLRRGGGGPGGGRARPAADPPPAAAGARGARPGARSTSRTELERPRAPGPAPRLRPFDGLAGARRRGARHPLDPAQRPVAGAARPRQVPAAHPGHGHQRDPPHRRRDRLGQGADQPAARTISASRCRASSGCAAPTRRSRRRSGIGYPGGGQAAGRQPRPRRLDQPDDRGAGAGRLREGATSARRS